MIGYGLRTLYINDIFEMKKGKGKILQCGLGHNCGFATVFWFKNFDCEYFYRVEKGDKIEIPKGNIEILESEYNGKKYQKIIIKTDWCVKINFNDKEGNKPKKEEMEELLNEDDNTPRFDDSVFGDNDKKQNEYIDLTKKTDEEIDQMLEESKNDWEEDLE